MLYAAPTYPAAPEAPDAADRLYELQRDLERDAGGRVASSQAERPSPEHHDAGPGGDRPAHAPVRAASHGSPPLAARSSVALPRSYATLADRRYLARVARVIPPRERPFNWAVEGL